MTPGYGREPEWIAKRARAQRFDGYAAKFAAEGGADPTDENLTVVLADCARSPRREWLPSIRSAFRRLVAAGEIGGRS